MNTYSRNKYLLFFSIMIMLLIALLSMIFSSFISFADSNATAVKTEASLITSDTYTKYAYFNSSNALAATNSEIYLASDNEIAVYSLDGAKIKSITTSVSSPSEILISNNLIITLELGQVICYNGDSITKVTDNYYTNIALIGETIYATCGNDFYSIEIAVNQIITSQKIFTNSDEILQLASAKTDLYFTSKRKSNQNLNDIYLFKTAGATVTRVYEAVDFVIDMKVIPSVNQLVAVTANKIIKFKTLNGNDLLPDVQHSVNNLTYLAINDYNLFCIKDTSLITYNFLLKDEKELLASSSIIRGFYSEPAGITTRKGTIYVADKLNDRVVLIKNSKFDNINFAFFRPTSTAVDNMGNLYVAHSYNLIEKFNSDFNHISTVKISEEGASVKELLMDAQNNLYALTNLGLYYKKSSEDIFSRCNLGENNIDSIAIPLNKNQIYFYSDGDIKTVSADIVTSVLTPSQTVVDFTIDNSDNIFILSDDGIVYKYEKNILGNYFLTAFTDYEDGKSIGAIDTSSGIPAKIIISTFTNDIINKGDILIVNSLRHSVRKIDGKLFNVSTITDTFPPPLDPSDTNPNPIEGESIIRTILKDTQIYSIPNDEQAPLLNISKGRKAIVLQYSIPENSAYSYVLLDGKNEAVVGYVYKEILSEALAYAPPPTEEGVVYNSKTMLFKYPSAKYDLKLTEYLDIEKETKLTMLPFVPNYIDESGVKWYRVMLGEDKQGFIYANDLIINGYTPNHIRPQTNAVIYSKDKAVNEVLMYKLIDGAYSPLLDDKPLAVGTKIEVVGAFDPSTSYTLIKYYNADYGTKECYIETVYIKYSGVNVLQIVTTILIITTIILIIAIFIRRYKIKKQS